MMRPLRQSKPEWHGFTERCGVCEDVNAVSLDFGRRVCLAQKIFGEGHNRLLEKT